MLVQRLLGGASFVPEVFLHTTKVLFLFAHMDLGHAMSFQLVRPFQICRDERMDYNVIIIPQK